MNLVFTLLRRPVVTIALLLLPIALFFAYFLYLRYNIPWFDEYEIFPYFLQKWLDAPTLADRWQAFIKPNNEHRLAFAHTVLLAQYGLTGQINFANLMFIGNLGLVVLLALLGGALHGKKLPLVYLLPVPLWLFTPQNYLLTFTAAYTLQYLTVIVLAFLTLYVLANRQLSAYIGAILLGLFCTFSMGNGLLVWPAGLVVLLSQKRWWQAGSWILVAAVGIWAYFYGYPVQQGNADGFAFVRHNLGLTLAGFLVYCGSWLDFWPNLAFSQRIILPFIGGLGLVVGLGWWAVRLVFGRKPISFTDAFLLGVVSFLIASMGLIALFRLRFSFGMVLWSSYRTYSLVLWATSYVVLIQAVVEKFRPKLLSVFYGLATVGAVLSVAGYWPLAVERRRLLQSLTFNQQYSQIGLGGSRQSYLAHWINDLTKLMAQRGWYALPSPAITPGETTALAPAQTITENRPIMVSVDSVFVNVKTNWIVTDFDRNQGIFILIQSAKHTYIMAANQPFAKGRNPYRLDRGFTAQITASMVDQGRYRVGFLTVGNQKTTIDWTNQLLDVP
jgi:hypothetical protein